MLFAKAGVMDSGRSDDSRCGARWVRGAGALGVALALAAPGCARRVSAPGREFSLVTDASLAPDSAVLAVAPSGNCPHLPHVRRDQNGADAAGWAPTATLEVWGIGFASDFFVDGVRLGPVGASGVVEGARCRRYHQPQRHSYMRPTTDSVMCSADPGTPRRIRLAAPGRTAVEREIVLAARAWDTYWACELFPGAQAE